MSLPKCCGILRRAWGRCFFSAQYQQAPEPAGGKIIKRKMLRYYFAVEQRSTDRIVLSWDIALSEKEAADYSACVVLLNRGDLYYVLDVIRGKFPFNKLIDEIIEVKERYGKAASLVIEDGGISYGLIQALREKHVNVVDYKPKGDKAERLISQIDLFEGGSVLLPKDAPWLEAFVAELMRGTIGLFKHCVGLRVETLISISPPRPHTPSSAAPVPGP